jgi:uncharacterized membrane protein
LRNRLYIFTTIYIVLTDIAITALYLLNEKRVDAYVAINILIYYTSYAITRPSIPTSRLRFLNIALLLLFIAIVGYRVYEVLTR